MMAGSAAEIKLLEYKDTIAQLNTLLTAQTELIVPCRKLWRICVRITGT